MFWNAIRLTLLIFSNYIYRVNSKLVEFCNNQLQFLIYILQILTGTSNASSLLTLQQNNRQSSINNFRNQTSKRTLRRSRKKYGDRIKTITKPPTQGIDNVNRQRKRVSFIDHKNSLGLKMIFTFIFGDCIICLSSNCWYFSGGALSSGLDKQL